MKKILIVIIVISFYLHFNPDSALIQWYENTKTSIFESVKSLSDVTFKVDLKEHYQQWLKEFNDFSPQELNNLRTLMETHESAELFHKENCFYTRKGKYFYGNHHEEVCDKLSTILQ